MTITINRNVLIAIVIALILVGIFYLANRANLIFRRFSATVLSSLEGGAVTVPQKISNLVAVSGNGAASLAWAAPDNGGSKITSYRIYRGMSVNDLNFLTTVDNESFADSRLQNGTTYYYKVAAANVMGEGPMSETVDVLPSANGQKPVTPPRDDGSSITIPGAINSLAAVAGNNMVSLAWSAPYNNGGSSIASYKVYRGTYSGGEAFLARANNTTFSDYNVVNGTTYYYKVSAVNAKGESPYSNEASANPIVWTTPVIISNQAPVLTGSAGDAQTFLSWSFQGNSPVSYYKIYRGSYPGSESYYVTANSTSYTNTGLQNGATYYYRVSAMTAFGESSLSQSVVLTPYSTWNNYQYQTPNAVSGLNAYGNNNRIVLNWSYSGPAVSGYRIYRGTYAGGEYAIATSYSVSYEDHGVSSGHTYYYRVSGLNSYGEGPLSAAISATMQSSQNPASNVPGQITNLSAQNNGGYAYLSWSAPQDGGSYIQQYRIYRGASSSNDSLIATTQFNNYTDSGVSSGHTYYYRVKAVNAVGESGFSNQASVTIPSRISYHDDDGYTPSYPSEYVRITSVNPSSITAGKTFSVSWDASSNFQGCRVWFQGTNAINPSLPRNGSTSFSTSGIAAGSYEVGVRCFRSHEIGSMSNYNEDDYMTNPAYNNVGLRASSIVTVTAVQASASSLLARGSFTCACNNGSVSGLLAEGVECRFVGGPEACLSKCDSKGGWTGGFTCVNA
ncbi:MAG: fibronectin type III domain-containing protein [Patescibacteria group bacterium]|nr:fibronectin type III domain-containing protein [Patescibacteria group bacterium]MCL5262086.1 fibronectin type III domain-containing protein [Patescibacteria group bacterium]